MKLIIQIWRWGGMSIVGAFVACYVGALLAHNALGLVGNNESELGDFSGKVLSATGTSQRWNMFAPNVGTLSYSPIVVLAFKDGRRIALHSSVEPDMPNWTETFPIPNGVRGAVRNYSWRFHVADGRIRKYESRAASELPEWWRVRTAYARWRATKWLAEHPGEREKLQRVELWRCKIRHPGYGEVLHCETVEVMPVSPYAEGKLWPVAVDPTFPPYWS
ncbi:MAG: hypothetical protein K8I27_01795 [Planctomycetes bacterium]|nr:hypothetical protein [Planctomycetota bacterium]